MKHLFTRLLLLTLCFSMLLPQTFAASLPVLPATPASTEPDEATVKSAVGEFKNLSAKERKSRIKEAKKAVKKLKAQKRKAAEPIVTNQLLLVIITILLPPLGVYLHQGEINSKFWISLLLTLLFYIPGLVYSLVVVLGGA
jgi:uncharacterized membrane protein YqaE (UPF0057 family)